MVWKKREWLVVVMVIHCKVPLQSRREQPSQAQQDECDVSLTSRKADITDVGLSVSRLRLLLTDAGGVMLGEARRTLAGEAADGVNAQELTVMLFGRTFIQI